MNRTSLRPLPQLLDFDSVAKYPNSNTIVLVIPRCKDLIQDRLPFETHTIHDPILPKEIENIIVVGGGEFLDKVKYWKAIKFPHKNLIAIPSIWGSGAEVSPIVVLNQNVEKKIFMGDKYVPNAYSYCRDLSLSLSSLQIKDACGDVWSHALEGFLSPLCSEVLRAEFAVLIKALLNIDIKNDPNWFTLGSSACWLQSQAGVGLIHGVAHQLEAHIRANINNQWGHAKLCSLFLLPVMQYNFASTKSRYLLENFGLNIDDILKKIRQFFSMEEFQSCLPILKNKWMDILRDPCTRTNSVLVRPAALNFFENWTPVDALN